MYKIQFFSVISFCASIAAILWYFCFIGVESLFNEFLKFLYFRSSRCNSKFEWSYLNITDIDSEVQTADESFSSKKTLFITIIYLFTSFALIATAVIAICESMCSEFVPKYDEKVYRWTQSGHDERETIF